MLVARLRLEALCRLLAGLVEQVRVVLALHLVVSALVVKSTSVVAVVCRHRTTTMAAMSKPPMVAMAVVHIGAVAAKEVTANR